MSLPYKNNTNTGGAPLCVNCLYAGGICRGEFYCLRDKEFHFNVGICNKYQERTKDNG